MDLLEIKKTITELNEKVTDFQDAHRRLFKKNEQLTNLILKLADTVFLQKDNGDYYTPSGDRNLEKIADKINEII